MTFVDSSACHPELLVLLGPTASGKTRLAATFAQLNNMEIISADSRQVYQHMNIGTGKDLDEYVVNNEKVPVHLIDIIPAGEQYHLHQFMTDFRVAFNAIVGRSRFPLLCGGTGLYIDAVLRGYRFSSVPQFPQLRLKLAFMSLQELTHIFNALPVTPYTAYADTSTVKRTIRAIEICTYLQANPADSSVGKPLRPLVFGINPPREERREAIVQRLKLRLAEGLVEETQTLIISGIAPEKLIYYGLEYKFVTLFLQGVLTYDEMVEKLQIAIQQYAKRQMTFFRKMEKDGLRINWVDSHMSFEDKLTYITKAFESRV